MHRILSVLLALLLTVGASSASAAPSRQEQTTAVFFGETQNWIAPPLLRLLEQEWRSADLRVSPCPNRSDDQPRRRQGLRHPDL